MLMIALGNSSLTITCRWCYSAPRDDGRSLDPHPHVLNEQPDQTHIGPRPPARGLCRARRLAHPEQRQHRQHIQRRADQQAAPYAGAVSGVKLNVPLIKRGSCPPTRLPAKPASVLNPKLALNNAVRSRSPEFSIMKGEALTLNSSLLMPSRMTAAINTAGLALPYDDGNSDDGAQRPPQHRLATADAIRKQAQRHGRKERHRAGQGR